METYDIVMIIVLVGAMLFGAVKGFAWQLASILSIVVSYTVAFRYREPFSQSIQADPPWNRFLAMLILYIGTSLLIWVAFRMISGSIDRLKLREFDRQVGALFGLAKGLLYCILITLFAVTLAGERVRERSCTARAATTSPVCSIAARRSSHQRFMRWFNRTWSGLSRTSINRRIRADRCKRLGRRIRQEARQRRSWDLDTNPTSRSLRIWLRSNGRISRCLQSDQVQVVRARKQVAGSHRNRRNNPFGMGCSDSLDNVDLQLPIPPLRWTFQVRRATHLESAVRWTSKSVAQARLESPYDGLPSPSRRRS